MTFIGNYTVLIILTSIINVHHGVKIFDYFDGQHLTMQEIARVMHHAFCVISSVVKSLNILGFKFKYREISNS